MKKLISLLLALSLCFALVACGAAPQTPATTEAATIQTTAPEAAEPDITEPIEPQVGEATPLLYRVTDGEGHIAWLFGSIHVGRENYYPLPTYVTDAFAGADALAVELDILAFERSLSLQMEALMPLVYRDGTTIKDHISEELYAEAVAALQTLGSYAATLDMYCPAFWSSAIESLMVEKMDAKVNLGIDRHLLKLAQDQEKQILEIESGKAQYEMLAGFSDELQSWLLEEALQILEAPDLAKQDLENLMDLWAAGDEAAFAEYLTAEDDSAPAQLLAEYNQAMIIDRNLLMTNYAEAALQSGQTVFICVGAAHVVGEGAMAQLLAQRGYTVEPVSP